MFSDIKKTVKQTAVYSLGNISSKLIGFILLPLYTDYLSVSEYGILAILEATSQILIGVFGFNIHTAMLRWAAEEKDELEQKSIIYTSLTATLSVVVILNALLLPFSAQLSLLFFDSKKFSTYFVYLFLASGFGILNNIPFNVIRLREKPAFYIVLNSFKFGFILLLNIYFIVYRNMGVEGIILSQLLGNLIAFMITIPFLIKNISPKLDVAKFKDMFSYGFPLIFSTTSTLALSLGDRYILKFLQNEASVGIYSLGNKVASVINVFIIQSFQLGFLPIAFKKLGDQNAKRFFSKVFTYFAFLLVVSALFFSLFAGEIIRFFTSDVSYWEAYSLIPLLSFGFVLKGLQYQISLGFHFTKKNTINALIVVGSAILNLLLNFTLIPQFDYFGAAIAMTASMLVMIFFTYRYSQKDYFVPYELGKIYEMILLGIILWGISHFTSELDTVIKITVKGILIISFPFLLMIIGFYDKVELERINGAWNKWKHITKWRENFRNL